jgi:hypothetical protein
LKHYKQIFSLLFPFNHPDTGSLVQDPGAKAVQGTGQDHTAGIDVIKLPSLFFNDSKIS